MSHPARPAGALSHESAWTPTTELTRIPVTVSAQRILTHLHRQPAVGPGRAAAGRRGRAGGAPTRSPIRVRVTVTAGGVTGTPAATMTAAARPKPPGADDSVENPSRQRPRAPLGRPSHESGSSDGPARRAGPVLGLPVAAGAALGRSEPEFLSLSSVTVSVTQPLRAA